MKYLELRVINPSRFNERPEAQALTDIAETIEADVTPPDASYLLISGAEEYDSSYYRYSGYEYPIKIWINQIAHVGPGAERLQTHNLLFWKNEVNSRCLASFNTNLPEDNFEGEYGDARDWIIAEFKKRLGFTQ